MDSYSYSCICASGFDGNLCQNNIDDCLGITCQNGGTCLDGLNSYSCSCVPGYGGYNCESQFIFITL